MDNFWNERYINEQFIWGTKPSEFTVLCEKYLQKNKVKDILIMGIGYGRNGKYFTEKGYHVDGIEISEEAVKIGKTFDPKINFIKGSILDLNIELDKRYDAVYCCDIMQLFPRIEQKIIIKNCIKNCKNNGIIIISCISNKDILYGRGKNIGENSFEIKEGHIMYFTNEEQIRNIDEELELIQIDYFIEEGRNRIYGIYKLKNKWSKNCT
ncbi:MAG: methyltransferase domain-containing protein [Spirochaetaceae bacterium]|jgi:2-polyprenyl-3-methyl-5-hydroxy-6-metoxy-1,4-benzoquinol methylase|nr:methyltransferase domain-containing protein [Spirochaetaceae bacterium]